MIAFFPSFLFSCLPDFYSISLTFTAAIAASRSSSRMGARPGPTMNAGAGREGSSNSTAISSSEMPSAFSAAAAA